MENKKFIVAIVILSILLVLSLGFIGYDKFLKKQDESIKTVINDSELDLNVFYKIGDILNNLDAAFNDNTNKYFGYIYGDRNLMIEKLDPKLANYISLYGEIQKTGTPQLISGNKVKSNMQNMFGKYVTYKAGEFEWNNGAFVTYDEETNTYMQQLPLVNLLSVPSYFVEEVSTAVGTGEIIVRRKVFYVEYELDITGTQRIKAKIYTDKDKKQLVTTMNLKTGAINGKEIMAKYSSRLKTYKYTFKEYNDTDYVLYSIEKERK